MTKFHEKLALHKKKERRISIKKVDTAKFSKQILILNQNFMVKLCYLIKNINYNIIFSLTSFKITSIASSVLPEAHTSLGRLS